MSNKPNINPFFTQIVALLEAARNQVLRTVNQTMVLTYFEIGRKLVEKEQQGQERATYGISLLKELSAVLTQSFGKGFSVTNLQQMRNFYMTYHKQQTLSANLDSAIEQTASANFGLSWSHYLKLMRIEDGNERKFYEIESQKNNWSVRELDRQYNSALFTRLSLSRDKNEILQLSEKGQIIEKPKDAIKDPYILEFIGLNEHSIYSENDLETELINKLEHFLLELGNVLHS